MYAGSRMQSTGGFCSLFPVVSYRLFISTVTPFPISRMSSLLLVLLSVQSAVSKVMSNERGRPMDFSVASSDSLWKPRRLKKNLPFILTVAASIFLAVAAVILKFSDILSVTYRVVDCKDILPYHETGTDIPWVDIEDEYFATSVIGFAVLLVVSTELAVVVYSDETENHKSLMNFSKECARTLIPLLNGLFAVTIITSLVQRISGTIKPYFLTICPAACAWPATIIRTKSVEEDLESCFNGTMFTGNSNQEHLKNLLVDARMSFPCFQEAVLSFVLVFITGYWHTKRVVRALSSFETLRLLSFTAIVVVLILMSYSKVIRHKNWMSDVWCGVAIGLFLALHQIIESHVTPAMRYGGRLSIERVMKRGHDPGVNIECELKRVNIPRVTYRRSLVERRRNQLSREDVNREVPETVHPGFLFTNKH